MRTMIIAAVAAMGLNGGVAYAGDGEEPVANTLFTQIPAWSPRCRQGTFRRSILRSRQVQLATGPAIAAGCLPLSSPCRGRLGADGTCLLLPPASSLAYPSPPCRPLFASATVLRAQPVFAAMVLVAREAAAVPCTAWHPRQQQHAT